MCCYVAALMCCRVTPGCACARRTPAHLLLLAAAGAGPEAVGQLRRRHRGVVQAQRVEQAVAAAALKVCPQLPAGGGGHQAGGGATAEAEMLAGQMAAPHSGLNPFCSSSGRPASRGRQGRETAPMAVPTKP